MVMYNIKINETKTKIIICKWDGDKIANVCLDRERLTQAKHFWYLWNLISSDGRIKGGVSVEF